MKRPDVYIGLVGAAGTDLEPVKNQLKAQFAAIGYDYEDIKVSKLIADFSTVNTTKMPENERITYLMNAGDAIRACADSGDGVISLVINEIRSRRSPDPATDAEAHGFKGSTLFVIDSLKNPAEITALDSAYARNYYTISVYSPEHMRNDRLAKLIAKSKKQALNIKHKALALDIMKQDEGRKPVKLSQDVLGTFPRAEFFLKSDHNITMQIKRFVELIFGSPFITPTQDENFMNLARTAALRSADLSRQVGAVIVDKRGGVISQGCNEVPYPGGGIYFEGRDNSQDNRDYVNSRDPNQAEIAEVVKDLVRILRSGDLLTPSNLDEEQFSYELLQGKWSHLTSDSRIRSLIEFGRVVHAEMHAICEAARLGRAIDGAALYCTTFPCHGCARHIIASGIDEVVFIEPYPKSLTKTLYADEIKTDEPKTSLPSAVLFRPFEGVSPILFRRVFNLKPRKNPDGSIVKWDGLKASPLRAVPKVLHYDKETALANRLGMIKLKYVSPKS